jgi:di/tricarboxylate transporter
MDLATISLAALLMAVVLSCITQVNVGFLAVAMAWILGVFVAPHFGQEIGVKGVYTGFDAKLFVTLAGLTLLFMQSQVNGTLGKIAHGAVRLCRGNAGLIPLSFFLLTAALSGIGAGSIAATALVAPMAMAVAARVKIPALLMTLMVGHGAIAGGLSPFALTGVVANKELQLMQMTGGEWSIFSANLLVNAAVALGGYVLFGGWRLFTRDRTETEASPAEESVGSPLELRHWVTLGVIAGLIVGVVQFKLEPGLAAFAGVAILTLLRMADEKESVRAMPWGTILMVCGMTMLVSIVEKTGGIDKFSLLITTYSNQNTIGGLLAFATGVISVFSSTSGVVLPTFLPMVNKLTMDSGGGDPWSLVHAINIGSNLVDVSPVSTIGALCLASVGSHENRAKLFNQLLAWGVSMSAVAAIICYAFFPV